MAETSKFKISVWHAFVPDSELILSTPSLSEGEEQAEVRDLTMDNSGLQREVFGWRTIEDPFGGIVEAAERARLKTAFFDVMSINIAPKKRSITVLKRFVDQAVEVLNSGKVEWSGSQSTLVDEMQERRINSLLALVNHLSWLVDIFSERPNTSVTIR